MIKMKLYKVHLCLQLVLGRLVKFHLNEYNSERPIVFVEAKDPDDACYQALHNLSTMLIKQDANIKTLKLIKDVMADVRVIYVREPS